MEPVLVSDSSASKTIIESIIRLHAATQHDAHSIGFAILIGIVVIPFHHVNKNKNKNSIHIHI